MAKWSDVVQDQAYKELNPEEKKKIKVDFFNEVTIPELKKNKASTEAIENQRNNFFSATSVLVPETEIKAQSIPAPVVSPQAPAAPTVKPTVVKPPVVKAPVQPKKKTPLHGTEEEYKNWVAKEKPSIIDKIKAAWKATSWSGVPRKVLDTELKKANLWKDKVKITEALKKKFPRPVTKLHPVVIAEKVAADVLMKGAKRAQENIAERYMALTSPSAQKELTRKYGAEALEKEKQRMVEGTKIVEERIKEGVAREAGVLGSLIGIGAMSILGKASRAKMSKADVDAVFERIKTNPKFAKKAYIKIKRSYAPKDSDAIIGAINKRLKAEAPVEGIVPAGVAKPGAIQPRLEISQAPKIPTISAVKAVQAAKVARKIIDPAPATEEALVNNIDMKLKSRRVRVDEVKKDFIKYAKEYLPLNERGKLLSQVKNVVTREGLAKAKVKVDAMRDRTERRTAIDDLKTTIKQLDIRHLRPEYKIPIEALGRIDLVTHSDKTMHGLESMKKFMEANPDNNIPQSELEKLNLLKYKKIGDMTTEDVKLVKDSITHLKRLQDIKNKMIFGRKLVDSRKVIESARANLAKKEVKPEAVDVIAPKAIKEAGFGKKFFTTLSWNPELITEKLDKSKHGIIKDVLYEQVNKGMNKKLAIKQEAEDYIKDNVDFKIDGWSEKFHKGPRKVDYQKIQLPSGKTITLTKGERVALYLHSQNKKNLASILKGGFAYEKNLLKINKLDIDDIEKIISTMSKEELKLAKTISDYYNIHQKNQINNVSLQLNGYELATEANYYPINSIPINIKKDYTKLEKKFNQSTLEGMGILKERIGGKTGIILRDAFSDFYNTVEKVSAYAGLSEPLRNAKVMLNDKKFRQDVANRYDNSYLQSLDGYLKRVEGNASDLGNVDKLATGLINKIDIAILGMNPWVMMKQPISYLGAATEINPKYLARAVLPEKKEVMSEWSAQLRSRFEGRVTRELGEIQSTGQVKKFWTGKTGLGQKFMAPIAWGDYQAVGRIWKAAQYETEALRPDLKGDAKMEHIARRTEEIVRLTQPTFDIQDRSEIGRDPATFVRLATKYSSQRNKNYIMASRAWEKYERSNKEMKDKFSLMQSLGTIMILSPLALIGTDKVRQKYFGYKSDTSLALQILEKNLGNLYVLGNIGKGVIDKTSKKKFQGSYNQNILSSTVEKGVDALSGIANTITSWQSQEEFVKGDRAGDKKWEAQALKTLNDMVETTALLKGIPYRNVKSLLRPILDPRKILPYQKYLDMGLSTTEAKKLHFRMTPAQRTEFLKEKKMIAQVEEMSGKRFVDFLYKSKFPDLTKKQKNQFTTMTNVLRLQDEPIFMSARVDLIKKDKKEFITGLKNKMTKDQKADFDSIEDLKILMANRKDQGLQVISMDKEIAEYLQAKRKKEVSKDAKVTPAQWEKYFKSKSVKKLVEETSSKAFVRHIYRAKTAKMTKEQKSRFDTAIQIFKLSDQYLSIQKRQSFLRRRGDKFLDYLISQMTVEERKDLKSVSDIKELMQARKAEGLPIPSIDKEIAEFLKLRKKEREE